MLDAVIPMVSHPPVITGESGMVETQRFGEVLAITQFLLLLLRIFFFHVNRVFKILWIS